MRYDDSGLPPTWRQKMSPNKFNMKDKVSTEIQEYEEIRAFIDKYTNSQELGVNKLVEELTKF